VPAREEVARLLIEWKQGNQAAMDLLMPLVYDEMRRLAESYLRDERAAAMLQPTALVHEAYLRLVGQNLADCESRFHFFGVAAQRRRVANGRRRSVPH
jgi:RNA polymerase sigma-70 factor (ECF subfamily)